MRLIYADRLKDEVVKWLSTDDGIEQRDLVSIDDIAASVMQTIDEQPTAYDVDKVVEELNYIEIKWDKSCPPPNEYGEPMCGVDCVECQIRRCREIVKRGGVNEQ